MALAFNWGHHALHGDGSRLGEVVGQGELLLVSASVVAAGVGDLMKEGLNAKLRGTKMTLTGLGILTVATSAWLYSEVANPQVSAAGLDLGIIVVVSGVVAAFSLVIAVACQARAVADRA